MKILSIVIPCERFGILQVNKSNRVHLSSSDFLLCVSTSYPSKDYVGLLYLLTAVLIHIVLLGLNPEFTHAGQVFYYRVTPLTQNKLF